MKILHRLPFAQTLMKQPKLFGGVVLFAASLLLMGAARLMPPPMPIPYAYIPSPNRDERPFGTNINCIVIHATVEPTTEGTINIFLGMRRRVSAHFVVGKDGRVVQMVPIEKRAWHAGVSELDGVPAVNDYSVGIELVNLNDGIDPYPKEQMEAAAGIIRLVRSRYDVPDARIVSHSEIARPVGRKNDPVGFDFALLKQKASEPLPQPQSDPIPSAEADKGGF